jgi:hypothetical protein
MKESLSTSLTPADQDRDSRRRWREIQREYDAIEKRHTDPRSGDAVHAAATRLLSFFGLAYHLKDGLIADSAAHGISTKDIEDAITADDTLALLADLANLDKHFVLTKPPRSGDIPVIGPVHDESTDDNGWQLVMPIVHKGTTKDGLAVARQTVDAWRVLLAGWGLP